METAAHAGARAVTSAGALLALALVLGGIGCSSAPSEIDREVERIRGAALAAGARLVRSSAPVHGQFSVETSWELESDGPWPVFCESFEGFLPPEYGAPAARNEAITFVKPGHGDTFRVVVALVSEGPPVRVRVTFQALAS